VSIRDLRREYASRELDEAGVDQDPIRQFRLWLDEAITADLMDATAMALATVTNAGDPEVRTVLLKDVDELGFVFFTHYNSPKGRDLQAHPRASLLFFWSALERQVRISGDVERVDATISDAYFQTRPRESQIAVWAAAQSSEIDDRATLVTRYELIQSKYAGTDVPRPADWGGYRLRPERIEFWQGRPSRLHDRLQYTRRDGGWRMVRLAP
jgi:pyridoxamine 5'-phosphate oxidase